MSTNFKGQFGIKSVFDCNERFHKLEMSVLRFWGRYPWCNGYRRRKWDTAARVQILDQANYISHSTNTLGKGMNPIILPPAMGKY